MLTGAGAGALVPDEKNIQGRRERGRVSVAPRLDTSPVPQVSLVMGYMSYFHIEGTHDSINTYIGNMKI